VEATLIVDKEIGDAAVDGIYKTIQAAINKAPPGAIIKVSPGIYDEHLRVK
jgi:pectin methylesterase-like acyl-CoA thioesterase